MRALAVAVLVLVAVILAALAVILFLVLATPGGAFEAREGRAIALDTIYGSFAQDSIKSVEDAVDMEQLSQISGELQGGPPRIVLCVGHDVAAAVKAASTSFSTAEQPVPGVTTAPSDTLWLAAYLGSDGSMPPAYQVRAVELVGKTLRVAYQRDESPTRSCDLRDYLIWAPVGRVEAGVYRLELFDVVAKTVTVSSSWQVRVK